MSRYPSQSIPNVAMTREVDAVVQRWLSALEAERRVESEGLTRGEVEMTLVALQHSSRMAAQQRARELEALRYDMDLAEERPVLEELASDVLRDFVERHHLTPNDLRELSVPGEIIERVTAVSAKTAHAQRRVTTL